MVLNRSDELSLVILDCFLELIHVPGCNFVLALLVGTHILPDLSILLHIDCNSLFLLCLRGFRILLFDESRVPSRNPI